MRSCRANEPLPFCCSATHSPRTLPAQNSSFPRLWEQEWRGGRAAGINEDWASERERERLENHGSPHPSSALVNSRAIWGSKESKRESGAVFLMECVLDEISENALCFGFQAGRFVPQAFSLLNKAVVNLPAWHPD